MRAVTWQGIEDVRVDTVETSGSAAGADARPSATRRTGSGRTSAATRVGSCASRRRAGPSRSVSRMQPGNPVVDKNRVTYANGLGQGLDLAYEVTSGSLKESVVVNARPAGDGDLSVRSTCRSRASRRSWRPAPGDPGPG